MPVTLRVVDHEAQPWKQRTVSSSKEVLSEAIGFQAYDSYKEILQSSYSEEYFKTGGTSASTNGLVWAAVHAYSTHHHLTIRPEDVWFAILTQISFYINAHAEELRSFFVDHDGKKELVAVQVGNRYSVDFGHLAQELASKVGDNVKDPALRDWVMPSFTTTTNVDRSVAAVLFMGAMQSYFDYGMSLSCGIPSVTLLGELSDWEDIAERLDFLEKLGDEPREFAALLRPVLKHMILSLSQPSSEAVTDFWNKIANKHRRGSGDPYLSGWITAFCFWDAKGKKTVYLEGFDAGYGNGPEPVLGSVTYPYIDIPDIPSGVSTVPVRLDDNGEVFECTMVAGSAAIRATVATEEQRAAISEPAKAEALTAIQPMSGWWMCVNGPETGVRREVEWDD